MVGLNKVFFESVIIAVINVVAVHMAATTYRLKWEGVLLVMVFASLISGWIAHLFSVKNDMRLTNMALSDATGILITAGLSSIAILVMLTMRFNLPEALGIALLSGGVSAFARSIIRDM
jgi:hypothetical protein